MTDVVISSDGVFQTRGPAIVKARLLNLIKVFVAYMHQSKIETRSQNIHPCIDIARFSCIGTERSRLYLSGAGDDCLYLV